MAERRMFAKTIVLSDAFLDMSMSARCLYFTLSMLADDDGFVNSPRAVMRQCGASDDDMKLLIAKKFVLVFDSGVIVVKHWRVNNYLRNDRYTETKYVDEKALLTLDEKGIYHREEPGIPGGIPKTVYPGKDSIELVKGSVGEKSKERTRTRPALPTLLICYDLPSDTAMTRRERTDLQRTRDIHGKRSTRPERRRDSQCKDHVKRTAYHVRIDAWDAIQNAPLTWNTGRALTSGGMSTRKRRLWKTRGLICTGVQYEKPNTATNEERRPCQHTGTARMKTRPKPGEHKKECTIP